MKLSLAKQLKIAQELVNQHARTFAFRYDIPSDAVTVVLVTGHKKGNQLAVRSGPVVQVTLVYPDAIFSGQLNNMLKAAFELIVKRRLWTPLEMPRKVYSYKVPDRKGRIRRWVARRAGNPEAECINLLDPGRIHVRTTIKHEYIDTWTGESIITEQHDHRPINGRFVFPAWVALSEQVFTKYPEELLDDDDELPSHPAETGDYGARDRGVAIIHVPTETLRPEQHTLSNGQAGSSRHPASTSSH